MSQSHNMYLRSIALFLFLFSLHIVYAQEQTPYYSDNFLRVSKIEYNVDWITSSIISNIYFRWEAAASSQYLNPSHAYNIAQLEIPKILSMLTKNIILYGDESLLDFARNRSAYRGILSTLLDSSIITAQIPDKDLLGTKIVYDTSLVNVVRNYIAPAFTPRQISVLPFVHINNDVYTSILIDLRHELPPLSDITSEHRMMYTPKLFPQVYSEYRRILVFTSEYVTAEFSESQMPFHYMYPEDYATLQLGDNPLLILPVALDAENNGDIVISFEDTRLLLSSEKNTQLLVQGKIYFIILRQSFMELQ